MNTYLPTDPDIVQAAVTHEFGHVVRLADISPIHFVCSEVQGLMYGSGSVLEGCGVKTPQTCDVNAFNALYAGATVLNCPAIYEQCDADIPCN
jgi:hypothetical protein